MVQSISPANRAKELPSSSASRLRRSDMRCFPTTPPGPRRGPAVTAGQRWLCVVAACAALALSGCSLRARPKTASVPPPVTKPTTTASTATSPRLPPSLSTPQTTVQLPPAQPLKPEALITAPAPAKTPRPGRRATAPPAQPKPSPPQRPPRSFRRPCRPRSRSVPPVQTIVHRRTEASSRKPLRPPSGRRGRRSTRWRAAGSVRTIGHDEVHPGVSKPVGPGRGARRYAPGGGAGAARAGAGARLAEWPLASSRRVAALWRRALPTASSTLFWRPSARICAIPHRLYRQQRKSPYHARTGAPVH